jgi:hypothetical protein
MAADALAKEAFSFARVLGQGGPAVARRPQTQKGEVSRDLTFLMVAGARFELTTFGL